MKKSTILTFATAAAVLATSAGTFAAWDQLNDTTQVAKLTFTEPKIIDVDTELNFDKKELNGTDSVATSQMKFDISGTAAGDKVKLSLVDTDNKTVTVPDGLQVTFTKGAAASSADLTTTGGTATDDSFTANTLNEYGVKISVKDDITTAQATALSTSGFDVRVKAEIINN